MKFIILVVNAFFLASSCAFAQGWRQPDMSGVAPPLTVGEEQSQKASTQRVGRTAMVMTAMTLQQAAVGAEDITAEIQAIADGLGRDPVRIYEWVKNTIDYVPYRGLRRGAHLTALERSGNDFDTSALLVALLKASGCSNVGYRFGRLYIPTERTDGNDASHWLGAHKTQVLNILARAGVNYPSPNNLSYTADYAWMVVPRVWVVLDIGGAEYVLDASFKSYRANAGIDINAASSYSKTAVLTASGGSLAGTSYTMGTAGRDGLKAALGTYAVQLVDYARNNSPSLSGFEASGGREIIPQSITALPTGLPLGMIINGSVEAWTNIPQDYAVGFSVVVGGLTYTVNSAELQGRKLAVWFNAGRAELWLDDVKLSEESSFNATTPAAVNITYSIAVSGQSQTTSASPLVRSGGYVIAYGYDEVLGRLQYRMRRQAEYVAGGEAATGRKLVTENLYVAGLQYQNQAAATLAIASGITGVRFRCDQFAGIIGQPNTVYFDLPHVVVDVWPTYQTAGSNYAEILASSSPISTSFFIANAQLLSAFEHIGVEQVLPNAAVSTVKLLQKSVDLGLPIYLAKNQAEYNSIKPLLVNYPGAGISASAIQSIETIVGAGGKVLIPKDNSMSSGAYIGTGYILCYNSSGAVGMMISGGYSGGHSTSPTAVVDGVAITFNTTLAVDFVQATPVTTETVSLSDPVDAATGAFYIRETDITIGSASPGGLSLGRHYSTARASVDPVGLGRGWTHSYNIGLNYRTPADIDLRRATVAEVAPYMVALKTVFDVFSPDGNAKEWVVPAVASCWLGEQLVKSRASIAMGESTIEFTKLPDGSFAPPAKINAALTKQGDGSHLLKFRKGQEITFRASDGKFTAITDKNTSGATPRTLSATYNTNGTLYRVTDSFERYFQFAYSSGKLTGVTDSTGRSVAYGSETVGASQAFTFTDPEGQKTRYLYDSAFRITEVRDPRGRTTITSTFDAWNRVATQFTFGQAGRLWKFNYAPGVTRYEDPEANPSWFYFDARGRSVAKVNELGEKSVTVYDGADREIETITPRGEKTSFTYNKNHEVVSVTNPALHTLAITPSSDDSTTTPRTENNFEGKPTVTTYYSYHLPKDVTVPGGLKTDFEYDTRGRVSRMRPPSLAAGQWITYTYDDTPGYTQRTTVTYPDATTEISNFNARGDLIQSIDRRGKKSTFAYNLRRQVTQVARWTGTYTTASAVGGTPPTGSQVVTTDYDAAGNVAYVIDPLGRRTDYDYDALGKLLTAYGPDDTLLTDNYYDTRNLLATTFNALGFQTDYNYDAASRPDHVLDPLGRSLHYGYDANGRRTTVTTALNYTTTDAYGATGLKDTTTDALNHALVYTYDKDGRLKTLKNRLNNTYTTTYDDTNRVTTTRTPLLKTTTEERNLRGLVAKSTQPSGHSVENTVFDAEGRVLTQVIKDSAATVVTTTTFAYYPGGLLNTVTEGAITTTRTYDDFGRIYSYNDGEGHTLGYRYDGAGNLQQLIYPDGKTVTYGYDDYNRLETVTDWASRVTTYTYDDGGRLLRTDRPNGTWRKHVYDAAGQLRQIEERDAAGTVLWLQALKYDLEGQITWTYTYPTPAAFTLPADTAAHDADNRIALWIPAAGTAIAPVFDDNGNMTSGPDAASLNTQPSTLTYTYDARNRLTAAAGQTYRYNPEGHRVQVNATTYVVDPAASLSRVLVKNPGGTATYYVWGLGLLYEDTAGSTKTYHPNHQGSTVALTNGSGGVTDRVEYAPYGAVTSRTGTSDTPFLLHGAMGVMTEANGLVYMRARYYHPRLMRFLNSDPIGFAGGLNWYAFANGNPITSIDPSGFCPESSSQEFSSVMDTSSASLNLGERSRNARKGVLSELLKKSMNVRALIMNQARVSPVSNMVITQDQLNESLAADAYGNMVGASVIRNELSKEWLDYQASYASSDADGFYRDSMLSPRTFIIKMNSGGDLVTDGGAINYTLSGMRSAASGESTASLTATGRTYLWNTLLRFRHVGETAERVYWTGYGYGYYNAFVNKYSP